VIGGVDVVLDCELSFVCLVSHVLIDVGRGSGSR
jgi:hypothetical protein